MTILAVDPGLATCGYAVISPRARVVELGTLVSKPTRGINEHTDRARRTRHQAFELATIARRNSVTAIAAEQMSWGGPGRFAIAISLCLSWGALLGLAEAIGVDVLEVPPKQWQHAITGIDGKVDYPTLFEAMAKFVGPEQLVHIPAGKREHAIDAVGVGLYALLRTTSAIRRVERAVQA